MINILNDYTFQIVALGASLLGALSGATGTFSTLKKTSLLGDGIAHSSLAGIALSFILTNSKNTHTLLIGAAVFGLFATFIIHFFTSKTTINYESSIAIVMSSLFGLGLCLLTQIQKYPNSNQAGLDRYLFGQSATMLKQDCYLLIITSVILLLVMITFFKEIQLFLFDPIFFKTQGFNSAFLEFIISSFVVISVILGIQLVGVVLMSSLLIAPSVAARQWSFSLKQMFILSILFGTISGFLGTLLSSMIISFPTGPGIVLIATIGVIVSLLFSPSRGLIQRKYKFVKSKRTIISIMLLIHFYDHHSVSRTRDFTIGAFEELTLDEFQFKPLLFHYYFKQLIHDELLIKSKNNKYRLSTKGLHLISSKGINYESISN